MEKEAKMKMRKVDKKMMFSGFGKEMLGKTFKATENCREDIEIIRE